MILQIVDSMPSVICAPVLVVLLDLLLQVLIALIGCLYDDSPYIATIKAAVELTGISA